MNKMISILYAVNKRIHNYDIETKVYKEDDYIIIEFSGHFFGDKDPIKIIFNINDDEVEFLGIDEGWHSIQDDQFWIDFMIRMYKDY